MGLIAGYNINTKGANIIKIHYGVLVVVLTICCFGVLKPSVRAQSYQLRPVVGDYDGDDIDDFGCYYPSSGSWYLFKSAEGRIHGWAYQDDGAAIDVGETSFGGAVPEPSGLALLSLGVVGVYAGLKV